MASSTYPATARNALAAAEKALHELDARCCEPGRSPRMAALADVLSVIASSLDAAHRSSRAADDVIALLESAGAQIGALQVGCCAANRLPLYAEMLAQLTAVQVEVNRSIGRGH